MDKKLPSISQFSSDKEFCNNKHTYCSFLESDVRSSNNEKIISNNNTIDDLFDNGQFIFNVLVNIQTTTSNVSTMIVGKVGDHIITSDNMIIEIKDIISIKIA